MSFDFKTRGTIFRSQLGKIRKKFQLKENLVIHLFQIRRCFGFFLKSVSVGKRDGFIIFSECIVGIGCKFQFNLFLLPFKIYLSSKYLMQRTEFFVGNQLF